MFGQTTPSSTFSSYFLTEIQVALKTVGIPLTIFQENLSNYYCSRAAYGLYKRHTKKWADRNAELYKRLFVWALVVADTYGTFEIPDGLLAGHIPFGFIREDHSVLDLDREAKGELAGVRAGLWSASDACARQGKNYYKVIQRLAQEKAYAEKMGVYPDCFNWDIPGVPDGSSTTNQNEI